MNIGLLLNSHNRLNSQSEKYREILIENNIPHKIIDPDSDALFADLKDCSHLLFQHTQGDTDALIYDALFNIAQNVFQIRCYPNYITYWPYENKIKEYYLLKSKGFPVIDTRVLWNHQNAEKFLKETHYPIVGKLPRGAGSSNVIIIDSYRNGKKIIDQIFKKGVKPHKLRSRSNLASLSNAGIFKYFKSVLRSSLIHIGLLDDKTQYPEWQIQKDAIILQKYLPDNHFDTRITVIRDRAFGFRRFVREGDFRASGSGNFDIEHTKIDPRCLKIAFDVSENFEFDCMAFDFLFDENNEPRISEISYCFVDWIIQKCPGYWDKMLNWYEGHFWPQQCQLEDLLQMKLLHSNGC